VTAFDMKNRIFNNTSLYIECGPIILESQFSGIPNVNYHLIDDAINRFEMDRLNFFHGPNIINKEAIQNIIKDKNNHAATILAKTDQLFVDDLKDNVAKTAHSLGIFTNSRHHLGREFDYECQIFHDLTPIITPEFHHQDTVEFHVPEYQRDIELLDCAICVSESTKKDLESYLGVESEKIIVSHLGAEMPEGKLYDFLESIRDIQVEPYILIIGTIEPRKNHKILFEFLAKNPEILDSYKVIVVGRNGWSISFDSLMAILSNLSPQRQDRVLHLGFVDDNLKTALISKASFTVYPSYYEGFGLPVLESLTLGCPVLSSFSSSLPEAGGPTCVYFDPDSIASFAIAFKLLESRIKENKEKVKRDAVNWAKQFTWESFCTRIYEGIEYRLLSKELK